MILLVWNAYDMARVAVGVALFPSADAAYDSTSFPSTFDSETFLRSAGNARNGPLSIRQKYLLEKRVDINFASVEEISELPGISEATAAAVVMERERIGGFRSPGDLLGIKGIKEKRLKKILPFLAGLANN